jgi:hypothetical protein
MRSTPGTLSYAASASNDDTSPTAGPRSANPFRRTFSITPDKSGVSSRGSSPEFVDAEATPLPPMPITAPPVHPLSRSAISQRDIHVHPPQRDESLGASVTDRGDRDREETLSDTALSVSALRRSKNPFNSAAQSPSVPTSVVATPIVPAAQAQYSPVMPPVPPRKPPALPPRISDVTAATLVTLSPSLPPRPPKLSPGGGGGVGGSGPASSPLPPINSSPLIKESLRAAKGAQAQKASETLLEKTLNWKVIKRSSSRDGGTSNDVGKNGSGRNTSPTRPPPPLPPQPRRTAPSPPISASSMEVLASASLPSTPQNRFVGDDVDAGVTGAGMSSGPVLGRSKSMHHQTSPSVGATMQSLLFTQQQKTSPVPPPPPRRRPESLQALPAYGAPAGTGAIGIGHLPSYLPPDGRAPGTSLSRRASIQSSATHSTEASGGGPSVGTGAGTEKEKERAGPGDAFAHLYESVKKRAEGFQRGAQPGFESVRRMAERAEGRVVPGGYIHPRRGSSHPGASERRGLVDGEGDDGDDGDDEEGREGGFGVDMDDGSPGVDVDDREWREWDRTVRQDDGRRGRPHLSNGPGMDDGEGDLTRRFDRLSPQGEGWQRL